MSSPPAQRGPVVTISSNKGGVGKTTLATNLAIYLVSRKVHDLRGAYRLSYGAMVADVLLTSAFVWLYAFDSTTAMWAVLFIMSLEGAIRFALGG